MPFINCQRCQKSGEPITTELPWDDETSKNIRAKICTACWGEWEEQAIIVINELGLKLFLPDDRKKLEKALHEFLGL